MFDLQVPERGILPPKPSLPTRDTDCHGSDHYLAKVNPSNVDITHSTYEDRRISMRIGSGNNTRQVRQLNSSRDLLSSKGRRGILSRSENVPYLGQVPIHVNTGMRHARSCSGLLCLILEYPCIECQDLKFLPVCSESPRERASDAHSWDSGSLRRGIHDLHARPMALHVGIQWNQ